jgi:hypothetical protein
MTSILEHLTGRDDTEEAPMTTPRQGFRAVSAVPWWAGVYGLDPAIPVDDDDLAAQCTAMACAVHVFGADAGYPVRALSRRTPAGDLTAWLLASASTEGGTRRRLALRLVCEQIQSADMDRILKSALCLIDACSPGRR